MQTLPPTAGRDTWRIPWKRRTWKRRTVTPACLLPVVTAWGTALVTAWAIALVAVNPAAAVTQRLVLYYVGDPASATYTGLELGVKEANLQGGFLGFRFLLRVLEDPLAAPPPSDAGALLVERDAEVLSWLAREAPRHAVFNLLQEEESLRALCLPNLLHVSPSRGMREDALAQWRARHPEEAAPEVRAWHPAFLKYAARDLNKRYLKTYGQPMGDAAWAGWAASRMLADAAVREQSVAPESLLAHLRQRLAFDGQKGASMHFRSDGQLLQPLLFARGAAIIGEAPMRGVPGGLESLGHDHCAPAATRNTHP